MNRKTYRHIFFDLDNTLWDFDANSMDTFRDLFSKYHLKLKGIESFENFLFVYHKHNALLWESYRQGKILKDFLNLSRFTLTLDEFGIHDEVLSVNLARDYVLLSPTKTILFPEAFQLLDYLSGRYKMHIITNGFEEIQYKKLSNSGLAKYFENIITSEDAGTRKPEPLIFEYALNKCGASAYETLMIGDEEEVDIQGAIRVGIDSILVDFSGKQAESKATYTVNSLGRLIDIL
ncbi:MAG: YjjG family noncanonical pyrimidine nucleotidase [Lentimicrobium sp.]|nr:YjjG family noncanonical pyrimidine nucleotidase [Lentimicrobium sp.]